MTAQPGGRRGVRQATPEPAESEYASLDRRRALRAFDLGALATVAAAVIYAVLWGALELQWGLIAVAIMLGWLVGAAVRQGAWGGVAHPATRRLQLLGGIFGAVAWLGGAFVAYLITRALLQSALSFAERLEAVSFSAFMTDQYEAGGLTHAISLAALAIMGWRTAR